jgi:hypothetical protein
MKPSLALLFAALLSCMLPGAALARHVYGDVRAPAAAWRNYQDTSGAQSGEPGTLNYKLGELRSGFRPGFGAVRVGPWRTPS